MSVPQHGSEIKEVECYADVSFGAYGVHCGNDDTGPDCHSDNYPHDPGQKSWQRQLRVRLQGLCQRAVLPSPKGDVQILLSPIATSPAI